ncbi:hypothetical protein IFR04_010591 [Cadophora malorum]|uniref:Uncharacterized protein n=1 Tax=Cadophora malorum TaxID=108018 RepID=A0A8H7W3W9_9HELO|nr:hypothetical protein IFR04_010591 [Cadophora malorum]
MTEEEFKPQKVPSWVDRGRPSKASVPTPTPGRTLNVQPRDFPDAPSAPRQMRELAYQGQRNPFSQDYQDKSIFSGMDPFSLMNLQMSAILAAQQMGPINSPMEQWGHLNPNFVFQGGQVNMGYAPHAHEQEATMEGVGSAIELVESAQPHSSYNSAAPLPKPQLDLSAEEIDDIADKIFEDLSDEKKRQNYLHPPASLATTASSQNPPSPSPSKRPTLPARSPSSKVVDTIIPLSSPASPIASLNPPSAPRLMKLRDGKDISKSESAYLRSNTNSPQSAKKKTGYGRAEVRERQPGIPSRDVKRQDRARGNNRDGAKGRIGNGLLDRTVSGTSLQDETRYPTTGKQNNNGSGGRYTGEDDGRLESLVLSTRVHDTSSAPAFPDPWVRPPRSISAPMRDPFLNIDPHYRRNEGFILQEEHEQEVQRLTASDVDKNIFLRQGGTLGKWPAKKSQSMEANSQEHYNSRIQLEQKPRRQEKKDIKAKDKHFVRAQADSGVDTKDLLTTSGPKLGNANSEPIINPRPCRNAAMLFRAGGTTQHQKSRKALLGTEGSGGSNTSNIPSAVSPVVCGVSSSRAKEVSHYTMVPSSDLRARHEHELNALDEGITASDRHDVIRRHRAEWDDWHAALPFRQAASQEPRLGEDPKSGREEESMRAVVFDNSQTSEGTDEVSGLKKKKRIRPSRFIYLTSSELTARHPQQVSSQLKSASEKEKKELLRRQEDELVKCHNFQESQRQEEVNNGDLQTAEGVPAKRKAIEDAKDGGSKKLVRLNNSAAASPRPQNPLGLPIAPDDRLMAAAVSNGTILSRRQETAASKSVKAEHSSEKDVDMGALPAEVVTMSSAAEFDEVFKAVENSVAVLQSGASQGACFEGKTDDKESKGESNGVGCPAQSPGSAGSFRAFLVADQLATQALLTTQESKDSPSAQGSGVAQAIQMADAAPATEPSTSSPSIPAGDWILDSFLDSLFVGSLSTPPPASLEPAPSRDFKGLSCALS